MAAVAITATRREEYVMENEGSCEENVTAWKWTTKSVRPNWSSFCEPEILAPAFTNTQYSLCLWLHKTTKKGLLIVILASCRGGSGETEPSVLVSID